MTNPKDGGPAFPGTESRTYKCGLKTTPADPDFITYSDQGVTIRQWYAGMALNYIALTKPAGVDYDESTVAVKAFELADAMLAVGNMP